MDLVQLAILGFGAGAAYVLIGQGIVLIYRGSGTLNFGQGAVGMIAAQCFFGMRDDLDWYTPLAFVLALALAGAIGAGMHMLVLRPLRRSSALVRLVATLGLLSLCVGAATLLWGSFRLVTGVLPARATRPLEGLVVPVDRLYLLAICVVLTAILTRVYHRTRFGLATAGAAENERAAICLGWSPNLLGAVNWAVGCALAGLAGILLASIVGLSNSALTLTVVPGMAAALIGRFRSFWLTMIGGLAIGIAQSYVVRYVSEPGWSDAVPFLCITALIVIRGQALPLRGEFLERPVRVGSARISWWVMALITVAAFVVVSVVSSNWLLALSSSTGIAIICLSFVVVTGYAGQISLAQLTIGGVGSWVAGVASHYWDFPMLLAILSAVAAAVVVGVLSGLPALRCRGMNLAVVTLGMSVVIEGVILANNRWQGGIGGLTVHPPELFGLDLAFATHPERYTAFLLVAFICCALLVSNIRRSQSGRKLLALRSNERAAASLGISVMSGKLFAFSVGAGIAGLGGAVLAFQFTSPTLTNYTTLGSITLLLQTVVGGMGFIFGGVQGGFAGHGGLFTYILTRFGHDAAEYLTVISAAMVFVMILVHPDGIASRFSDLAEKARRRRGRRPHTVELASANEAEMGERSQGQPLRVEGVTVRFGTVVAADDVGFQVEPGEILGVIGPNGAGKTTVIDALCGFVRAEGHAWLGEVALHTLSTADRARRGLARTFQGVELFDDMSVLENVQVAADCGNELPFGLSYVRDLVLPRRRPLSGVARAAVTDLLKPHELALLPGQLPAGRQRLAGIARALATDPQVIFLDEPAAGLGDSEATELAQLIREIAERWNLGVVVVEHNVEFVRRVSDRVLALDLGRVIATGSSDQVLNAPAVIAAYIGEPQELTAQGTAASTEVQV